MSGAEPTRAADVVVAGHICLDLIPRIATAAKGGGVLPGPGQLVQVGPVTCATGGAVANTGLALHRLGVPVRLVARVGSDPFGAIVRGIVEGHGAHLAAGLVTDPDNATSYSIVISPPDRDRAFLHHPGANDAFRASDVTDARMDGARLLHFGYPPVMARFLADDGAELVRLMRRARERGLATSLDMAMPDADAASGRADWPALLRAALPLVDAFAPSFDELAFMLRRELGVMADGPDAAAARRMAAWCLDAGCAMVMVKRGERGLLLRTSPDAARVSAARLQADPAAWTNREVIAPAYEARVAGATGAGDCAVAGFLCELLHGGTPESAADFAAAVGACNVEQPDATSGIPARETVRQRLAAGWTRKHVAE